MARAASRWVAGALLLGLAGCGPRFGCRIEPQPAVPDEATPYPDTVVARPEVNPPAVRTDSTPIPAPPLPSGLVVPVQGIRPEDLTDTFNEARSEGRIHNALDILAPRGTPVVAAVAGRVLRLFTSDRGGLTLYQLGPDGHTVYYYAHLDSYAPGLTAGQELVQGQVLGYVGDTGNAAPGNTHLHFAMWRVADPAHFWDGEAINPYPLLARPRATP
ncbi:MAG TPA: M23 family metallopeptidase [Rubricoccaceae bacterium]|nr:M23 family metallopeptidase [Rubricoccaceae bacterium]